jgi:hypothetical protein
MAARWLHSSNFEKDNNKKKNPRPQTFGSCFHCGAPGHQAVVCPSKQLPQTANGLKSYQETRDYKKKCDQDGEAYCVTIEELEPRANNVRPSHDYIMNDLGATRTMTPDKGMIINERKPRKGRCVRTATGGRSKIKSEGDCVITDDVPPIKDAMHVPELTNPLLSMGQAIDQWNAHAIVDGEEIIYVKGEKEKIPEGKIIMRGFRGEEGLYWTPRNPDNKRENEIHIYAVEEEQSPEPCVYEVQEVEDVGTLLELPSKEETKETIPERERTKHRRIARVDMMKKFNNHISVLHGRFGHLKGLARTIRYQGVIGLPKDYNKVLMDNHFCVYCLMGKQHKCSHSKLESNKKARKIGELFHSDHQIKPIISWNGMKYGVVMVEHVSGFVKLLPIQKKSQLSAVIIKALKWFATQIGRKAKEFQCDGGGEYIGPNTELHQYLDEEGMQYRISVARTPQSNGKAEVYGKIVCETGVTIRKAGKVPDRFWPESEKHAALLLCIVVKKGKKKTPFEFVLNYRPTMEFIKPLGCHVFSYIDGDVRNKFSSHTRPGIYMGVAEDYNACLLYDIVDCKFFVNDSCVCDEFSFGFKELETRVTGRPEIPLDLSEYLFENKDWYNMSEQPGEIDQELPVPRRSERLKEKRETEHQPLESPPPSEGDDFDGKEEEIENEQESENEDDDGEAERGESYGTPFPSRSPPLSTPSRSPALSTPAQNQTPILRIPVRTPASRTPFRASAKKVLFEDNKEEPPTEPKQQRRSERLKGAQNQKYYGRDFVNQVRTELNENIEDHKDWLQDRDEYSKVTSALDYLASAMKYENDEFSRRTPKGYRQAINGPDAKEWNASMIREMYAHEINATFTLVPRPSKNQDGRKHLVMRCVWKYRIKSEQNIITNYKSRLCADGSWIVDEYANTFAGTPLPNAINFTFATAAKHGVFVESGDIPAAYVQAPVPDGDTTYYIEQPDGFKSKEHPDWVLKLNRCLYGIPCSGHQWNATFSKFLVDELGMKRLASDPAVYFIADDKGFFLMPNVVDDTLSCSTSPLLRNRIHKALIERFRWKFIGTCTWYLGMRVTQTYHDIKLDQTAFLTTMLERFGHLVKKTHDTPAIPHSRGIVIQDDDIFDEEFPFLSLVGCLIWLLKTRTDIAFATSLIARGVSKHCVRHHRAALRILGYLKKRPNWGIGFKVSQTPEIPWKIHIYADASYADKPDLSSSYGYTTLADGGPISQRCKSLPGICTSICEGEYHAIFEGSKEATFMKMFLDEMKFKYEIILFTDNEAARRIAQSWSVSQRTKHFDIRCHYVRYNHILRQIHGLEGVPGKRNPADCFTKAQNIEDLTFCRGFLMMECVTQ